MVGKNLYSILKKNYLYVWITSATAVIMVLIAFIFAFSVYKESQKNMYAINNVGELVPLKKLDEKKDRLKQVQANISYFVNCYYDLDSYTMKEKKEKVLWLVGKKPTQIIKDRDKKGYFNNFLTINGLVQHARINDNSWKIHSMENPYDVSCSIIIQVINGERIDYYNCDIRVTLEETNKNYPYNPYGLIITNFAERLTKVEDKSSLHDVEKEMQNATIQN